jgi:hypothetical protein
MGCAFAAAAPASHATHYRINALVKHSRQPLRARGSGIAADVIVQRAQAQDDVLNVAGPVGDFQ